MGRKHAHQTRQPGIIWFGTSDRPPAFIMRKDFRAPSDLQDADRPVDVISTGTEGWGVGKVSQTKPAPVPLGVTADLFLFFLGGTEVANSAAQQILPLQVLNTTMGIAGRPRSGNKQKR